MASGFTLNGFGFRGCREATNPVRSSRFTVVFKDSPERWTS
jgi:hypothetical protein